MKSNDIFDAITKIAEKSGKTDKQALVGELLQDDVGKRVLVACYDPFVTYGMAKIPEATAGTEAFDHSIWDPDITSIKEIPR